MADLTTHGFERFGPLTNPANFDSVNKLADSAESVMCPAYTGVTFNGSWTDQGGGYEEASYALEGQRVWLRGNVKHATTSTTGIIFTLPSGYRPTKSRSYKVLAGPGFAVILINNLGQVAVSTYTNSGDATSISLDYISFDTAV